MPDFAFFVRFSEGTDAEQTFGDGNPMIQLLTTAEVKITSALLASMDSLGLADVRLFCHLDEGGREDVIRALTQAGVTPSDAVKITDPDTIVRFLTEFNAPLRGLLEYLQSLSPPPPTLSRTSIPAMLCLSIFRNVGPMSADGACILGGKVFRYQPCDARAGAVWSSWSRPRAVDGRF